MRTVPTCKKCSRQHWNCVPCEKAAQPKRVPEIQFRPREGVRLWGDDLPTLERLGSNTFLRKKGT